MTRFVVFGDTHFRSGHARNEGRLKAMTQIVSEGLDVESLGAWLWLGDVFDQRSSTADRNAVAEFLRAMAAKAPVVLLTGNHEQPQDLDIFARLKTRWPIMVVDTPQTLSIGYLPTGAELAVACLPYPTRSGLVAAGIAPYDVPNVAAGALDAIFAGFAGDLAAARARGALTLMIGHATIGGATSSVGQPMGLEHDIAVDGSQLARLGDIPKLFGHIHKPQEIHGAVYVGSIAPCDWGEREEKRYLVVQCLSEISDIRSMPIDLPPLYHVEAELTRDGFFWQVQDTTDGDVVPKPETFRGAEVRCRYHFKQSEKSVVSDAALLAEFAEAARLEVEPVAVPDRALRSPEVAAARTLADKLLAWCRVDGATVTDGVMAKLSRLEHGDHLQLLTDVQDGLAQPREEVAA